MRLLFPVAFLASLLALAAPRLAAAEDRLLYLALVPGRDQVVLADGEDRLLLLSLPDLEVVERFRDSAGGALHGVAVAGNGRWLAADFLGAGITVWNLESRQVALSIPRAQPSIAPVFLFHPSDDVLLVAQGGHLERWNVARRERAGDIRSVHQAQRMSLSSDGRYLVSYGDDGCQTGDERWDLCLLRSADGLVLARAEMPPSQELSPGSVESLAWARDDRISLLWKGPGTLLTHFLLRAGDLRTVKTDSSHPPSPACSFFGSFRSAPRSQECDRSSDRRWQAVLDQSFERQQNLLLAAGSPYLEISELVDGEYQPVRTLNLPVAP